MTDEERHERNKKIVAWKEKKLTADEIRHKLTEKGYDAISLDQISRIYHEYTGEHPSVRVRKIRQKDLEYVQQTSRARQYEWPLLENIFNHLAEKGIPVAITQDGNMRVVWKKGPWWVLDKQKNISKAKKGDIVIFGDIIKTANNFEELLQP